MKKIFRLMLIASTIFIFEGCITGKMSAKQESALGAKQEKKVLSSSKLSNNPKLKAMLIRVGKRIAKVSNRPDYQWKFHLIKSNQANAFVLPGGKIFVYTGLFKYASNDAELASVIGHEVAHALKSHGIKGSQRQQTAGIVGAVLDMGMGLAGIDTSTVQTVNTIYGQGASLGYIKPHSRKQELQADSIGLMLMAKGGYNPHSAVSFWKKFSKASSSTSEFLSTHPAPKNRISNINKLMSKAMGYYNNSAYRGK